MSSPKRLLLLSLAVLGRDFRAELDEVTPTLKLRRDVVARNFADVLQNLYA
ncbi:MAG TPA: hypothetical protein VF659_21390 [Pyrinomonadaceae bacterium]|jgi:long-subunit acyl-CoA synthetase (AMP-forming)